MRKTLLRTVVLLALTSVAFGQQPTERMAQIEQSLKDDVPRILCIDPNFASAGQPKDAAFEKLKANGFKSVLNLRTSTEVDLNAEKEKVEKAGLRYISIPVVGSAPKPEQAEEFLKAVKDKQNQPMLIHCGSANRVGGFWMIHRVLNDGWSEEKALEEATKIGLVSPVLKTFATEFIASKKAR